MLMDMSSWMTNRARQSGIRMSPWCFSFPLVKMTVTMVMTVAMLMVMVMVVTVAMLVFMVVVMSMAMAMGSVFVSPSLSSGPDRLSLLFALCSGRRWL